LPIGSFSTHLSLTPPHILSPPLLKTHWRIQSKGRDLGPPLIELRVRRKGEEIK
jgi:hypothetical protein